MTQVRIFDTTLRDGEQAPGFSMTEAAKFKMARALAALRVDVIEAGFAAASPGDFRALQGICGGMMMGLTFTIVGDIFSPVERGKYQGVFSGAWGMASVFGPTLGGWLTDQISWRATFYVNAPVGLVALNVAGISVKGTSASP